MPIVLLKLFSTFCAFGATTLLVLWLVRRVLLAHRMGVRFIEEQELSPQAEIAQAPLLTRANKLGVVFLPLVKHWEATNRFGFATRLAETERQLIRAGIRYKVSPPQILAASVFSAIFCGCILALLTLMTDFGFVGMLLGFPAGALLGFFLPKFLLGGLVTNRVGRIEKRLPFATEFMLLVMEANAAFPMAMEVYSRQMSDDPLADEFGIALADIESGLSPQFALEEMANRIASEPLAAFVLAIKTGIETGQPLKDVLEIQADTTRQRRYQSAELVAKTASTRAVFPLFIVVLAILLLLIGPLFLNSLRNSFF